MIPFEKVKEHLSQYNICLLGTYTLDSTHANDIDICVKVDNNIDVHKLDKILHTLAKEYKKNLSASNEYDIPFSWGGITYSRYQLAEYDIFAVDSRTFRTIQLTTRTIQQISGTVKDILLTNKYFRVQLFQLIAGQLYHNIGK